jgi:hypothetical protein
MILELEVYVKLYCPGAKNGDNFHTAQERGATNIFICIH